MIQAFKKLPYKLDVFIIVTIVILSIAEWTHIDILFYCDGLRNTPSIFGFLLVFVYEPLKIITVIFAIIRFLSHLRPEHKQKKYIVTALLSVIIFIGSWILLFTCHPPGAVFFLKGYEKWVHKNVDIDAIQTWLLSGEADKYVSKSYYSNEDFPEDLPDFMTDFSPNIMIFHGEGSEKGKSIEFRWGGGLVCWGIVVGTPAMKIKQEGMIEEPGSSYVEHRRPIIQGVYIFEGG